MLLSQIAIKGFNISSFLLAQTPVPEELDTAEDAALVFSGPQFFTALVAGVVLAFALQLLLTNLGVATGISLLGGKSSDRETIDRDSDSIGSTINKIGTTVGIATVISVTVALFVACLLAVKLSLFVSPASGAIVGLVIWATYFSLLVWVSSTTVGSLIGSVINTATSGFQAIWGTAAAVIGSKAINAQVVATAEAAAGAVRREIGSALDPVTLKENLQDYIETLRSPELNLQGIGADLEKLLEDLDLQGLEGGVIPNLNKETFSELVSSRSDLSKRDVERLAAQLEKAWQQKVTQLTGKDSLSSFVEYLKSATPQQLLGGDLSQKIGGLVDEMRKRRKAESPGSFSQAMTMSFNALMGMVMGRTDLSDLDVEKIGTQLQDLQEFLGEQKNKLVAQVSDNKKSYSSTRADIENYLLNAYPWQLRKNNLDVEFRELLYDADADPEVMANELENISQADFVDLLQQKGLLTQDRIRSIAQTLEEIRLEAVLAAREASEREKTLALLTEVEDYLTKTPKQSITPETIQLDFQAILEDKDASYEQLSSRLAQIDRPTLQRMLELRQDLTEIERSVIIRELELARERVLTQANNLQEALKGKAERQWLKLESYLQSTGKEELNPQAIERELKLILEDPEAGLTALRSRASRFDRDTLVKLLSQRRDLSEREANEIIDEIERTWREVRYAPQKLAGKVQEQYDRVTSSIADYLRSTGKEELNPEGIKRDLARLLNDPGAGAKAIRNRLARMDRDTLVQLLSQREDITQAQANEIIDEVQANLRALVKAPRRIAQRTQAKAQEFQESIANYLRSTDKEELNPEGIKRDIQLLINDPRAGMESLQERLSHFDRDTLVALLSQREDISQADVNRIIDQILEVRDSVMAQLQSIQERVRSIIDRILANIRNYLNSLERPELNYEGIERDLRKVFDDPGAGFEALRDRFSQIDRDTLVAILSSREDISEADADRLIANIERSRDRILQRAERLQQQAQLQLERVKLEAEHQLEETRKAAAAASWWVFFTALLSAIASAGAGALGVID